MITISISEADKQKPIDQIEKAARAEWDKSSSLHAEFKEFKYFVAYCRASAAGRAKHYRRK